MKLLLIFLFQPSIFDENNAYTKGETSPTASFLKSVSFTV